LTNGHISVSQKDIELVHQLLQYELGEPNCIEWISKNWEIDIIAS
jgi:hypothetical protein